MTKQDLFIMLTCSWGSPLTIIGLIVSFVLKLMGYHSYDYKQGWIYEIGENWGGLNLGPCILIQKGASDDLKDHEFGHAIQNCMFGPFTIFLVHIPSIIRYWYYELYYKKYKKYPSDYYSIWFEAQASKLGKNF